MGNHGIIDEKVIYEKLPYMDIIDVSEIELPVLDIFDAKNVDIKGLSLFYYTILNLLRRIFSNLSPNNAAQLLTILVAAWLSYTKNWAAIFCINIVIVAFWDLALQMLKKPP